MKKCLILTYNEAVRCNLIVLAALAVTLVIDTFKFGSINMQIAVIILITLASIFIIITHANKDKTDIIKYIDSSTDDKEIESEHNKDIKNLYKFMLLQDKLMYETIVKDKDTYISIASIPRTRIHKSINNIENTESEYSIFDILQEAMRDCRIVDVKTDNSKYQSLLNTFFLPYNDTTILERSDTIESDKFNDKLKQWASK